MLSLFAHAGEVHLEGSGTNSWQLLHQPTWVGLLGVVAAVTLIYFVARALHLALLARLLVCVASLIVAGIVYLPHNAAVTGIVLSAGFIGTFLLVFTMLGGHSD